jgi:hypothetical protein
LHIDLYENGGIMNFIIARKKLSEVINFESFPVEEYQDKYYFLKRIKSIFPELSEKKILGAIEFANLKVNFPGKKKKYINALSFKMFLS